jgi:uncharacterized OsmC-like protein
VSLGDATLAAAAIAAATSLAVAFITLHNRERIKEIHVLVNGRMAKAMEEIERLKERLGLL